MSIQVTGGSTQETKEMPPEEALIDLMTKLILHDFSPELVQNEEGRSQLTLKLDGSQPSTYTGSDAELNLLLAHLKTFQRWERTLQLRGEAVSAKTNIASYQQGIIALTLVLERDISMEAQAVGQFTTRPLIDYARCARLIMVDGFSLHQAVRQSAPVANTP